MSLGLTVQTNGVGAFDFVVERFANVVQEAGFFGGDGVEAHFGGHEGHELGDFDGLVQDVLGEAVAEFERAEAFGDFGVHGRQAEAKDGVFAGFDDVLVHFAADFGDDFFDAGGVDAAILHEAEHGFAGGETIVKDYVRER